MLSFYYPMFLCVFLYVLPTCCKPNCPLRDISIELLLACTVNLSLDNRPIRIQKVLAAMQLWCHVKGDSPHGCGMGWIPTMQLWQVRGGASYMQEFRKKDQAHLECSLDEHRSHGNRRRRLTLWNAWVVWNGFYPRVIRQRFYPKRRAVTWDERR